MSGTPIGPQTLGDMSLDDLISSADRETQGLVDFIEKSVEWNEDQKRWVRAYGTSIRVRLAVAGMKLDAMDNALIAAAREAQALQEPV